MDIMRPLRVRIDVTEGTATPAQPDPQMIHLNAAQTQPPQERPLPRPTPALPPPPEAAVPGAPLPAPRAALAPRSLSQQQGRLLTEMGSPGPPQDASRPVQASGSPPATVLPPALPEMAHLHND